VKNNGKGIPIKIHKDYNIYVPELIFGQLLTSSNYNDNEKKVVGGRNGYGAKLTNIFSKYFVVQTADKRARKKFKMVWRNNMSIKEEPEITSNEEREEYTKITFKPDLQKFGMERLEGDIISLMKKRVNSFYLLIYSLGLRSCRSYFLEGQCISQWKEVENTRILSIREPLFEE